MPRGVKKEHLPNKICVTCGRPFNWRKKWERCWDEVTTCSKSCNRKRREAKKTSNTDCEETTAASLANDALDVEPSTMLVQIETEGLYNALENEISAFGLEDDDAESISSNSESSDATCENPKQRDREERKAAKKAKKAARRAQREGRGDPSAGQKPCDMCGKSVDLLIRCTYDDSQQWKMVCGKCWHVASGGVKDGDSAHPYYRYGGLWKNRRSQK